MVKLVSRTLNQVGEFLFFFFFTIMLMSTILKSTGFDIVYFSNGLQGGCDENRLGKSPEDILKGRRFVAEDNSIIQYYIYTFWNAIGQATEPCYPYWMNIINKQDTLPERGMEELLANPALAL